MNLAFLDWAILISLLIFIFRGFRSGIVQQILGLLGSIAALVLAFYFYGRLGILMADWLKVSENLGSILGFILIMVAVSAMVALTTRKWKRLTGNSALSTLDSLAGAFFGALKVLIVWVLILSFLSSLQWDFIQKPLVESTLAEDVLKMAPFFYFLQERALPANVPKLFITPEGMQLRTLDYEDLDGSTCVACGGEVHYHGRVKNGLFYFPLFECRVCGRRSDGCQTFEGFHLFYRRCPWEGKTFITGTKCEIWTDQEVVYPTTLCPVCGRSNVDGFVL
ncbi:MAG: CvpA family protein [Firmicutes bacterium]|nr:CvpA family protein [Bacillota bacterium]